MRNFQITGIQRIHEGLQSSMNGRDKIKQQWNRVCHQIQVGVMELQGFLSSLSILLINLNIICLYETIILNISDKIYILEHEFTYVYMCVCVYVVCVHVCIWD